MRRLSGEQYAVLEKIARVTKMDCWFSIRQHRSGKHAGEDYVYDMENRRYLSLRRGVRGLFEGIVSYDLCELTDREIRVFECLLVDIGVPIDRSMV